MLNDILDLCRFDLTYLNPPPKFYGCISSHYQGSHSDWKNWKTWKNGKAFSSQGKVREFWTDWKSQGKVRENHTKYWKIEGISEKIICYFSMIFKWTVYYLLKCIKFLVRKNKTLKKYWKMEKNTGKVREKSGNFVSPEKWEPWLHHSCSTNQHPATPDTTKTTCYRSAAQCWKAFLVFI